ncbi:hypothetical protein LSUE1_G001029 [Lachnellula suecica]|uniref:DUF7726 domain-containing protein n=1 Tax=Lachnellula suecica TaxID=602035 RepID=A0A8T9CLT8_9HELO|nr:hypothetical protein LSUE1_G001029 [Lachnellula suecica]
MASNPQIVPRQALGAVNSNATIATPVPATNKRKATDEAPQKYNIDDDICQTVDISCDRVRTKIRNFINSGEMKVGEFQKEIGANSKSYSSFMGQTGPYKGSGSCVYSNAFAFFKLRELSGIKAPKKKVKKEDEVKQNDVSAIQLEGEAENAVEAYDTCDEVRKKIRAYLATPSVTQAGFLREIAKTYGDDRKIQSKVLNDFLGKKGPMAGNTSSVFYSSYVFFEKLRIRDGKPKSKARLEMEGIYQKEGGVDTKRRNDGMVFVMAGERPYEDKYGRVRCL